MKLIIYSELRAYTLRLPSFSFEDRVIINFHMENASDIEIGYEYSHSRQS